MPRMSGKLESGSGPDASTTERARKRLRVAVVVVHTPASSSNVNPVTSWPNRTWRRMSKRVAISSMWLRISSAGEYVRDQVGFLTNENEYSSDGMSQLAPG